METFTKCLQFLSRVKRWKRYLLWHIKEYLKVQFSGQCIKSTILWQNTSSSLYFERSNQCFLVMVPLHEKVFVCFSKLPTKKQRWLYGSWVLGHTSQPSTKMISIGRETRGSDFSCLERIFNKDITGNKFLLLFFNRNHTTFECMNSTYWYPWICFLLVRIPGIWISIHFPP